MPKHPTQRQRLAGYNERVCVPAVPPEIPLPGEVPVDHFTKTHHSIHEYWMRRMSGNAFKVFCWVHRQIAGWVDKDTGQLYRHEVAITLDEFAEYTGITNRDVLLNAIQEAIQVGAIEEVEKRGQGGTKFYRLRHERTSYEYVTTPKRPSQKRKQESLVTDSLPVVVTDMELPEVTKAPLPVVTDVLPPKSRQSAPGAGPAAPKESVKETSQIKQERKHASVPSPSATEQTALAGSRPPISDSKKEQEAERAGSLKTLQDYQAEQRRLQAITPGSAGWGETQRELRRIESEIARLQAETGASATPGEGLEDIPPTAEFQEAIEEYNELKQDIAEWQQELESIEAGMQGPLTKMEYHDNNIRKRNKERKIQEALARKDVLAKFLNIPESA